MQTVSVSVKQWIDHHIMLGSWIVTVIRIKTEDGKIGSISIRPYHTPKEVEDLTEEHFKEFFSEKSLKSFSRNGEKQYPWREMSLPEEYVNFLLKNGPGFLEL